MVKMRIFFLLSTLALISVTECKSSCGPNEECLEASGCEFYTVEREKLNKLKKNTADWTIQLSKLKSLVCNARERKVCCEKTTTTSTTVNTSTAPTATDTKTRSPRDAPNYRPSLAREECGELNSHAGFILGGEDTRLGEYPFLALLGRERGRGRGTFWHCGGTLINKWYVISAAHCGPKVDFVRLGEWDVVDPDSFNNDGSCIYYNDKSRIECEEVCHNCKLGNASVDCENGECSSPHQDIAVAEVKIHSAYGKSPIGLAINDIMLLKLSRPVEYNAWVKPICLPEPGLGRYGETDSRIFDNNRPTVVGWGRTETAKDDEISIVSTARQQYLKLPAVANTDCIQKYQDLLNADLTGNIMPDQHLCAGGEKDKDSCKGDSGGPLMAREDDISPWQIVGVVSGGTKRCGIGAPGIFTRVTHYDQWITDNMI